MITSSPSSHRVLVVTDSKTNGQGVAEQLRESGFDTAAAFSAQNALDKLREMRPDAIVLDAGAEFDLLDHFRGEGDYATAAPVVVLASRGNENEAAGTLEQGADDFAIKPLRPGELEARLRAVLRRRQHVNGNGNGNGSSKARALRVGPLYVNADRHEAYLRLENGEIRPLRLTRREFALLVALMRRKNTMVSRDELVREAFGEGARVNPANLGAYIHRLREKIEPERSSPQFILTDRGLGFKIVDVGG